MTTIGEAHRPSGEGTRALLPMALVGGGLAICLAPLYTHFVAWLFDLASSKIGGFRHFKGWGVLLLFVWALGAGLAGGAIGSAAGAVGRALACRNPRARGLAGVLLAGLGLYAYYDAWALAQLGEGPWRLLGPGEILAQLQAHLADRGLDGKLMAAGTYVLEGLFYWAGIALGMDEFLDRPYCEECRRWTTRRSPAAVLTLPGEAALEALAEQLRAGERAALDPLPPAPPSDKEALLVELDVCEGCEGSQYLTLRTDANPGFQAKEPGLLDTAKQIRGLTSAKGLAKGLRRGAEEEFQRRVVVSQLRVDAAFVGRCSTDASAGPPEREGT